MWRAAARNGAFPFAALVTIVLFFHPLILSGKTLFFRDIQLIFFPMKSFLAASLKDGVLPFWCSSYYCGAPYMSDMQTGVFYPLSLVFLLLPFPWSFNGYVLLHIFLAFSFFYLFIKGLGLSRGAALFTAISYCYGGYTLANINILNNLTALIWLPAILWSCTRAASRGGASRHLPTVLFLSLAILGGEPQLFLMTAALLFCYALAAMPGDAGHPGRRLRRASAIPILIAAAGLVTLVQLGPTFIDYQHSARLGGMLYEEAAEHSLGRGMLKHLLLPLRFPPDFSTDPASLQSFFPGSGAMPLLLAVYPGFLILPLAVFGLLRNFRKVLLFWLAVFLVSLALALGDQTPVYYLFYNVLPFFRFPVKFMFLAHFSLLVIAAHSYDSLVAALKGKGVPPWMVFIPMATVLTADLYFAHRNLNPVWEAGHYRSRHPDLQRIIDDREVFRVYVDRDYMVPLSPENTIRTYHDRWQSFLVPNTGIMRGLSYADGQTALELRYQFLITEILSKPWPERIEFLRLANVKYVISRQGLDKVPALRGRIEKAGSVVYRVLDPLPRAWMVGQLLPLRRETAEKFLRGVVDDLSNRSFDPATSALASSAETGGYRTPFFRKVDSIRYGKNGEISIAVTAERPGIVILTESYYPGWRVFVDGAEKRVLHLDLLFQGVEVPQGEHRITFRYRPRHFPLFAGVSLAATLLFAGWFAVSARRRQRRGRQDLSFRTP